MSKKPRKKKHSSTNRVKRNTKGYTIESWESWGKGEEGEEIARACIEHPILGDIPVSAREWDRVCKNDRNWKVQVFVKCLAPDNTEYTEEAEIIATQCRLNDLSDFYKRMKAECLAAVNHKHIQDTGWKAKVID